MRSASSSPSGVTVGMIPTNIPWDPNPVPSGLFWTGAVIHTAVTFLSHAMDINRLNDGIQLGDLGPMMGIDRVCPHHLIGVDWAQNQSRIESKLITLI